MNKTINWKLTDIVFYNKDKSNSLKKQDVYKEICSQILNTHMYTCRYTFIQDYICVCTIWYMHNIL